MFVAMLGAFVTAKTVTGVIIYSVLGAFAVAIGLIATKNDL